VKAGNNGQKVNKNKDFLPKINLKYLKNPLDKREKQSIVSGQYGDKNPKLNF